MGSAYVMPCEQGEADSWKQRTYKHNLKALRNKYKIFKKYWYEIKIFHNGIENNEDR